MMRIMCELQKVLQHKAFLRSWQSPMSAATAFFAFRFWSVALSVQITLRTCSTSCVNTSLSGTLFFSMCWCIRN